MIPLNIFRHATALFCLTIALSTGCGRDRTGGRWETPAAQAESVAPTPTPDPTTPSQTTTRSAEVSDPRPKRSGGAAPGLPRKDVNNHDAPGAPGAPQPKKSTKKAAGAPIRIPARVNDEGRDLDVVLSEMRRDIKRQCGGDLCITLRVQYSEPDRKRCSFQRTEPPQRTMVPRGSTVAVIAGTDSCTPETTDSPSAEAGVGSPSP
jgi:hypothetical protein